MDFIKFESARDKERIRQELREARDQMLDQAKLRREQRLQRDAARELRGETNWMLPTVASKIDKLGKRASESKRSKRRKEKVTSKKSKKRGKHSKKRKKYSSTESDPDTSEVDSDDSSSDGEPSGSSKKKKKRNKKKEYSSSGTDSWDMPSDESTSGDEKKKSNKTTSNKQNKGKESSSTSTSDSDSSSDTDSSSNSSSEEDVRKKLKKELRRKRCGSTNGNKNSTKKDGDNDELEKWVEKPPPIINSSEPLTRDSWMTDTLLLKTFSKERKDKSAVKQTYEAYDPAKSTRELNPYWKTTGTGLPGFKKPTEENEDDSDDERLTEAFASASDKASGSGASKSWRKTTVDLQSGKKEAAFMSIYSSESSDGEEKGAKKSAIGTNFLTDQQMNELGAKLLKAEIMGNNELAAELKLKLENARKDRAAFKECKIAQPTTTSGRSGEQTEEKEEEHVLLMRTDERGNTRPLEQASRDVNERDLYGGRNARKKQRRLETHAPDGERMRYFPDDDKYDIKQMFEHEKYTSATDANLEFAKIAGKHKNPNDDLDDIFADEVRKDVSRSSTDRKEMQRAINEHQRLSAQLDNCRFCFDSAKMDKSLLVSMGEQVYLALPWHIGLQPGHCIISTTQHVSCCTQLDENTWSEVNDFLKALTRMFAAQKKDIVFFEIASHLSRRPHLNIHCVPIPDKQAEMAPFYFKKAVEESELEWSVNKQLISLGRDGKGLRNSIPKGLPYFWVNFGMASGFAHVIEDEDRFPANFALEIIGGILELDAKKWRKPQKEQNTIAKVKMFADWWRKYDCTK
ncbi:PREDICTED: CWF19-like protein 2 homolog [Rhagoletis zephyria]|uniref:CWF19-like protein 2 homolog n=1 Tax=Rhagoletis zephyria TaxID=28612 RepID=UPI0008116F76|nr:PREDICTED: CWF19-like protein 2 homolog [Rhagoletis zephyria]